MRKLLLLFSFLLINQFVQGQTFLSDPAAASVCDGETATFTVFFSTNGAGVPTFQWDVAGTDYTGTSGSIGTGTYTIASTLLGPNFWTSVFTITNTPTSIDGNAVSAEETALAGGPYATNTATLTVNDNPSLTALSNMTVCEGSDAAFTSVITATAFPYTYTWTRYSGATTDDYATGSSSSVNVPNGTVSSTTTSMDGDNIGLVITDGNGCIAMTTPANATLNVDAQPVITTAPSSGGNAFDLCAGDSKILSVTATNATSYQWYSDGLLISGATNSSYDASSGAGYSVEITNGTCNVNTFGDFVNIDILPILEIRGITTTNASVSAGDNQIIYVDVRAAGSSSTWRAPYITWSFGGESFDSAGTTTAGTGVHITPKIQTGTDTYRFQANLSNIAAADVSSLVSVSVEDTCTSVSNTPFRLPVELLSFKGVLHNQQVDLNWTTGSELNNSHFTIERSIDGKEFTPIGRIHGAGTTQEEQNYTFTDETPFNGINYYRLKQVDFDGQFEYSEIVNVNYELGIRNYELKISPNPVLNEMTITNLSRVLGDGKGQATIYNMLGQPVREFIINNEQLTINTSDLPNGQYLLQITKENGSMVTKRFMK